MGPDMVFVMFWMIAADAICVIWPLMFLIMGGLST